MAGFGDDRHDGRPAHHGFRGDGHQIAQYALAAHERTGAELHDRGGLHPICGPRAGHQEPLPAGDRLPPDVGEHFRRGQRSQRRAGMVRADRDTTGNSR